MLNIEDGLVHCTDRNVPGSRIRLEFTIMAKDNKFLATINAVRPGQEPHLPATELAEPIRETLTHMRRDKIIAWAVAQAERINEGFCLGDSNIGYLRTELGHLMDMPTGNIDLPFMPSRPSEPVRHVDPAPAPEAPAAVQPEQPRHLSPEELMTSEDVWEAKPESMNPRSDIETMFAIRKGSNGFLVHLRVEMGTDVAQQVAAVATVPDAIDWLRRADVAKAIVGKLGIQEPTAYELGRRWTAAFTVPIEQFHLRGTDPSRFWSDDEKKQRRLTYPRT